MLMGLLTDLDYTADQVSALPDHDDVMITTIDSPPDHLQGSAVESTKSCMCAGSFKQPFP